MSYYHVEPPARRRLARRVAAATAAGVLVAAAVGGWLAWRPVTVTVDGERTMIAAGTTVRELGERGAYRAPSGNLRALDGSVVATGAGAPAIVLRNGAPTKPWQRLYRDDVLVSRRGPDRQESVVVTEVLVPFQTLTQGEGSVIVVKTEGQPGIRRVSRGSVSGIEVKSTTLSEPVDAVLTRMRPKPGSKIVALTFDDGPWPGQTDKILDTLSRERVTATFFMLGVRVNKSPALARRVAEEGHLVGNHTSGHRSLKTSSMGVARHQVLRGREIIRKTTGVDTPWLRPPYGAMDGDAWKIARSTKSRVVMWTVDSRDWKKPGAKKIADKVVREVKPGSVVLFHDGGGDRRQTVKALPSIIRRLRAKGYVFVTVDELRAVQRAERAEAAKKAKKL